MQRTIRATRPHSPAESFRRNAGCRQAALSRIEDDHSEVEAFPLRIPFKPGAKSAAAWGDRDLPAADSLLVKETTDQGIEGWGEAFGFRAVLSARLAIDELIVSLCIGRDAGQIAPLMLDIQKKLHIFWRGGALVYGLSAVDIALWDIAGKAAKLPDCRLLGGSNSADLACYASLIRYSDPALVCAAVRGAVDGGFHLLELHEIELLAIRAPREGPDLICTLNEARTMAEELGEIRLRSTAALGSPDPMIEWRCSISKRRFMAELSRPSAVGSQCRRILASGSSPTPMSFAPFEGLV
jgi:hypothetical protein